MPDNAVAPRTSTYNRLVLLALSIGSFNYGLSLGVPSAVIGLEGFLNYFNVDLTGPNPSYASSMQGGKWRVAIVGVFFAGGFFGSFFFAWLADKVGRKRALDVVGLVSVVGVILSTAATHVGMLIVGRIIQGLAGGGLNVICPMFQSEISVAEHRGSNVGLHGFLFVSGLATATWAGFGAYFASDPSLQWRVLFAIQAVPALALLAARWWLPESPRWLAMNGHPEKALETLCKLHDTPEDRDHKLAKEEQQLITKQLELDSRHNTSWIGLFSRASSRKRLFLGMFLMFLQQSTGQNVLFGFQVNVLNGLGVTGWKSLLVLSFYTTWAATLNFVGAGALLDRLGRRTLYLGGLLGCTVADAIHTPLTIKYGGTSNLAGQGAAVAFLFLFITCFAPGIDVTSYVYGAEIFPTYMRARGLSVTIATYFAFAALYVSVSSTAQNAIGAYFNICKANVRTVFIGISTINWIVGYFILPETKGLSLESMGLLFGEADEVAEIGRGDKPRGNHTPEDVEAHTPSSEKGDEKRVHGAQISIHDVS
ncbi:hypothetical protein I350_02784 [Cryptococcus amylolentus CBS 6273]|uniref:Major facilitator superfamily (MFS) profile domain-containing protein n=1 Tax=Cryptococcus amylolentus CBS 6273 TaxID=1296118 RepID=A0A1E3K7M3_9TREE|nr:hypothetical protein I350_02784 [Cryptococcus amylolentus CBS 6273]